ncbi:MAG: 4Fe-4S binding protein [Phycisphaerales bacterium]
MTPTEPPSTSDAAKRRCAPDAGGAPAPSQKNPKKGRSVSLPVANGSSGESRPEGIRPSKNAKRRAIVLGAVQLLIFAHIGLWLASKKFGWFGGYTLTPVEPSEAMETLEYGYINAGFIFFALALASTLIVGRFFCGWGCHVVLLQDACGWMMKKVGVRPKAFRSRLLILFPLGLALYMFVWPNFKRFALFPALEKISPELHTKVAAWLKPVVAFEGWSTEHLLTTGFWDTFPTVLIAIPFLFICGFAAVYFLGAKGFCTYGCPYGGFFAPLDKLSPVRIRVTDACEGCGHCTAVCTSNVRVSEEVRAYGMVVDPGCMKCMDCVSVCPKEALYLGVGAPAVMKGAPKRGGKAPKRKYDLTWPEEFALAGVFLLSFFAFRGLYGVIPMLMAVGVAGCLTFILWKAWRAVNEADVRFHKFQLKRAGSLRPVGVVWLVVAVGLGALLVESALVQWHRWRGDYFYRQMTQTLAYDELFNPELALGADTAEQVGRALAHYHRADSFAYGGLGLARTPRMLQNMSHAFLARGEYGPALGAMVAAIGDETPGDQNAVYIGRVMILDDRVREAIVYWNSVLQKHPEYTMTRAQLTRLNAMLGGG